MSGVDERFFYHPSLPQNVQDNPFNAGLIHIPLGSARMVETPSHDMPEPWSDRQVILAIVLTLVLVLGLILGSVSSHREQQAPMLWRETPQPRATPLAI